MGGARLRSRRAFPRRRGGGAAGAAGAPRDRRRGGAALGARRAGSARPARPDGDLRRAADHRVPRAPLLHRDAALDRGLDGHPHHPFSGAFQVLDGSSLHTRCAFAVPQGERAPPRRRPLAPPGGAPRAQRRRRDHGGPHPTASSTWDAVRPVVVRTGREADLSPAFAYLPPNVAEDPLATRDEVTVRRRRAPLRAARVSLRVPRARGRRASPARTCTRPASCSATPSTAAAAANPSPRARRRREEAPRRRRRRADGVDPAAAPATTSWRASTRASGTRAASSSSRCATRRGRSHLRGGPRDAARLRSARGGCSRGPAPSRAPTRSAWTSPTRSSLRIFEALLDGCAGEELLARLGEAFDPEEVAAAGPRLLLHAERIRETSLAPLLRVRSA